MPTLDWIGKKAVLNHHREVPYRLLRCDNTLSAGDPDAGNLLVQGDNLLALKALLPYYAGKVKCIYIDPPYNTGNENWVYNDAVNSPEMQQWLGKVVGREAEDLTRNDKWLCMMYPRLSLLKDFLAEDGSIFISIDDNEVHALRYMMDEIFGPSNFLGTVIWEKADSPRMDAQFFSGRHDYIIVYARTMVKANFNRLVISDEELPAHYDKTDEAGRRYYLKPLRAMGGQGDSRVARPTLYYPLTAPDGSEVYPKKQDGTDGAWRWRQEKVEEESSRIDWVKGRKGWSPYFRIYSDKSDGRPPETIWFQSDVGSNRTSKAELKRLFPELNTFATPKPSRLIERILRIATNPGDIVLDSFAGSGTTGHAVLSVNASNESNISRRFILLEMDENICRDVTAQRLERVIKGHEKQPSLGGGFKFCTLAEPLFDKKGNIHKKVTYPDLATHVFFTETGQPIPKRATGKTPFIGVYNGTAVYLLFNGMLGDKQPNGGNVLTNDVLRILPVHDGTKVIYGTACRLSPQRLKRENIIFRQTPYEIRTR